MDQLLREISGKTDENEELKVKLNNLENTIVNAENGFSSHQVTITNIQTTLAQLEEGRRNDQITVQSHQQQIAKLESLISGLRQTLAEKEKEATEANAKLGSLERTHRAEVEANNRKYESLQTTTKTKEN